jgi:CRISPR-associated protein Cas1
MLFCDRVLRAEHFSIDKGECLLGKAGRERFYAGWESHALLPRRWLRRQCAVLAAALRSPAGMLHEPVAAEGMEDL